MDRYEYVTEIRKDFWEISIAGSEVTTKWGRIGTTGQTKVKSHDDDAKALKDHDQQVAAKVKEGYEPVADGAAETTSTVRYEYVCGIWKKEFWEITIAGTEVTTRWGRVGTDGQTEVKRYDDEAGALNEYDGAQIDTVLPGWEPVPDAAAGAAFAVNTSMGQSNPELEAAIRESPNSAEAYLVYGDWLLSNGDPLGELVSIQHALAKQPDDSMLRQSESDLMQGNIEYLFGPDLPENDASLKYEEVSQDLCPKQWQEKQAWRYRFTHSVWQNGFMNGLIFNTGYRSDRRDSEDAAELLATILALPSARFVQRIGIGEVWQVCDGEAPETTHAIDAIAASPCAGILRELEVTGGDHDLNGIRLCADSLWESCPNLETVVLYAGQIWFHAINAPKVKRFAVRTGSLDSSTMKLIAEAQWPALESLEIWFGSSDYGANCKVADVLPLLEREDLQLKELGLMNMEFGDELCAVLINSPLLKGLSKLDLTMGTIGEVGARALIDNKDKFAHIERVAIAGYFSGEVAQELKTLTPNTVDVEIRGPADEEYRYVEVGE